MRYDLQDGIDHRSQIRRRQRYQHLRQQRINQGEIDPSPTYTYNVPALLLTGILFVITLLHVLTYGIVPTLLFCGVIIVLLIRKRNKAKRGL